MFNICKLLLLAVMVAAPALTSQAPAQSAPVTGEIVPYRINPGDELEIHVWGEERLQRVVRVLPDGTFAFPLAGQFTALGQLPSQLEAQISEKLAPQFRGSAPQVTVSVRNPTGLQFSVIGKVRSPGTFTPGRYVNALEALSFAGGTTEFADLGSIVIIRKDGPALRRVQVYLSEALRGRRSERDLSLAEIPQIQGGDTVVVP